MKKYQVGYDVKGMIIMAYECEDHTPTPEIDGAVFVQVTEDEYLTLKKSVGMPDWRRESNAFVESPTRPSPHHEWDWTSKSWLPNLDAARESQRQAWNAWRDRELVAGYVHEGHRFHTNDGFMGELHLLLKGHEEGLLTGTSSIRTMANEVLQKTGAEIKTLLLILGQHRQAIYPQSWAGKDALASMTTLEDIVAGGPPS